MKPRAAGRGEDSSSDEHDILPKDLNLFNICVAAVGREESRKERNAITQKALFRMESAN